MTTRTSINFGLDLVSLVVMIGLAATGGLIHFVLPPGTGRFYALFAWNRHDIGQVHFYLAVAAIALLALHVLLHWTWICGIVGKGIGREAPSRKTQITWGLALLLGIAIFLGGGLWWASIAVRQTTPEGGGRGRRGHLEGPSPGVADPISGRSEEAARPSQPTDALPPPPRHVQASQGGRIASVVT